jgi:hypothetical protein
MVFIPRQLQVPKIDENLDFHLSLQYGFGLDFVKIKRGTDWFPWALRLTPQIEVRDYKTRRLSLRGVILFYIVSYFPPFKL